AAVAEICYYTGVKASSFKPLEKRGVIALESREVFRRPKLSELSTAVITELSEQQRAAYGKLAPLLECGKPEAALLYGVTGSGKTAVYIKLIDDELERGRGAIVLVPEIALTPQLMAVFMGHFGDKVAVLHSSLSVGERYDEWRRIRRGDAKVVIGTRSAVFAPVHHLGLLIIDEEQESSYVSENPPRYNARDVAKVRCVQHNAVLLLGSATPSVESMYAAKIGRYHLTEMTERYNEKPLPTVIIADMKRELKDGNGGSISSILRGELTANLAAGEQSILFINRRGAHSVVACPECGHTFSCPSCSVNLTYHTANRRLMCHYCGHSEPLPPRCPKCGGLLKFVGTGTQKVEEELGELFPGTELLRMDTDTVNAANPHEAILKKFEQGEAPILVGTQMITKGLNFPNVTLVGVINSDTALYAGDYRAQERTFALITQVIGRAGRDVKPGRAVIQSFTPQNEVIRFAAAQDYGSFYEREIDLRKLSKAPPFSELNCIAASGVDEQLTLLCSQELKEYLDAAYREFAGIRVLGPSPAPVKKVNSRYRYRVFVSSDAPDARFRAVIATAIRQFSGDKRFRGVQIFGSGG
ncbi:MAG: primosomal protein N', partial [Oscillospiraceae bacterium]|nr:primosomal protein N' [Oscillospiraceae bacterium]